MSDAELQPQTTDTLRAHTLRVAIFNFYDNELLALHGASPLIRDVQEIDDNGLLGITYDKRAETVTSRNAMGMLGLKIIGRKFSVEDYEGNQHDAYAMKTLESIPYSFIRRALYKGVFTRRQSLDDVYRQVNNSVALHSIKLDDLPTTVQESHQRSLDEIDKIFDPTDALILAEARDSYPEIMRSITTATIRNLQK